MNKERLPKLLLTVDDTKLDKNDLPAVYDAVADSLAAEWRSMCTALGLLNDNAIAKKFFHDPKDCLKEVLRQWLNQEYDTERHGFPSWKKLVEAVAKPAGGSNPALAENIAEAHKKGGIHPPMHHPPSQLPHHGQQLSYPSYQPPNQSTGYQQPSQQLGHPPSQLPHQQMSYPSYPQPNQPMGYQQPSQQLGQPTSQLPNQLPYQQQSQPPHQQMSYPSYPQPNQPMGYQQPNQQPGQPTSHLPNQPPYQQPSQLPFQQLPYQQPDQPMAYQQPDQPPLQQLPTQFPYQQSSRSAPHQLDLSSGQSNGRPPPNPTDPPYAVPPSTQPILTAQNLPHPNQASCTTRERVAVDSSSPITSPTAKLEYSDFTIIDNPPNSTLFSNPTDAILQTAFPVKYWKGLAEIHRHRLKDGRYLRGGGTVLAVLDTGINNHHAAFNQVITADYVGDGIGTYREMSDHGTHCAGVAAGLPYHNAYITSNRVSTIDFPGGVAPDTVLVMSRVGSRGVVSKEAVSMALVDLGKPGHRVDVISMSFGVRGNECPQWKVLLKPNIDSLVTNDHTTCVAAASNVGATTRKGEGIAYPALDENVLSIGAHDDLGYKSKITPPEDKIDFLALGEYVWAPSATDDRALICSTGTSCATPAVAGLICLIIQYARERTGDPAYAPTLLVITNILRSLTRDPSAGKREGEGYGPLVIDSFEQFKTAVINGLQLPP